MVASLNVACGVVSTTAIVETEAEFDRLKSEWDQLLDHSDQRTYFLRWAWIESWRRSFRPPNSRLFIITCRDQYGRLVGLAPFYWRRRRTAGINHIREVLFLGTGVYAQTSEYLDVIARRGYEQEVAEAVADALLSCSEWDHLCLKEIPSTSTVLPHLQRALGEGPKLAVCNRSHYVDTTVGWDSYLRGLSRSSRQNIVRHTRQIFESDGGARFYAVQSWGQLETAIDALIDLHQARWQSRGEPGAFALSGNEQLLSDAARFSLREGRLRLWVLEIGGRIAAVQLAFFENGVVHNFQGGFDPARARNGLGAVMIGLCIRECMEDPAVLEYDFMGGGDSYKDSWTRLRRESLTLTWLRPGMRSTAYKSFERAKAMGKALVRMTFPESIRLAGHRLIAHRHYK